MQGCVVLQGLEQACMDVACTAVVCQLLVDGSSRARPQCVVFARMVNVEF